MEVKYSVGKSSGDNRRRLTHPITITFTHAEIMVAVSDYISNNVLADPYAATAFLRSLKQTQGGYAWEVEIATDPEEKQA